MNLVKVTPFIKSLNKESLTYFSSKDIPLGSIVTIPVRNKQIDALVVEVKKIGKEKSDIKGASFNLKKVSEIKGGPVFNKSFLDSCHDISEYLVTNTGSVMNSLLPKNFLENYRNLTKEQSTETQVGRKELEREKLSFQAPTEDRLVIYKTYVRESLAKKESIFFCFPTIEEAKYFYDFLKKGIDEYCILFSTTLGKKDITKRYKEATDISRPVIIFSTPRFLFVPRSDIGTIVLEHESSSSYKMPSKPYIDGRIFTEIFSYNQGAKIIFADSILSTETIWKTKNREIEEFRPLNFRLPETKEQKIIDMRTDKEKDFEVISEEVFLKIKHAIENEKKIFLFTLRRGYATTTICNDCGTTLTKRGEPLILYEDKETGQRIYKTIRSRRIYDSHITCPKCESWNLVPLGIGTGRVYEEVKRIAQAEDVFVLDKDTASTPKKAKKILEEFNNKKGGILIGTEMALFYLKEEIDDIAIVSFDTLFNIPNYNIYEKIINLIVLLNTYTKNTLYIQTRFSDEKIIKDIQNKNLIQFFKDDIKNREEYKYPPFFTIIKVSYNAPKREKSDVVKYLHETYQNYEPYISETRVSESVYKINMIIKIERSGWSKRGLMKDPKQDKVLLSKLKILPSYWSIQINPEQLN